MQVIAILLIIYVQHFASATTDTNNCKSSCLTVLSSFQFKNCTSVSNFCCESKAFLGSFALCIENCDAGEKTTSWRNLQESCMYSLCDVDGSYYEIYSEAVSSYVNLTTGTNSSKPLAVPVKIESNLFDAQYAYLTAEQRNRRSNVIIGIVMLLFWPIIVFFAGLKQVYVQIGDKQVRPRNRLERWIQREIIVPGLLNGRHAEAIRIKDHALISLPLRWEVFVLTVLFAINLILVVAEFDTSEDAQLVMTEKQQALIFAARRTGVMAMALLPALFQFSGRNSYVTYITGWSYSTFKVFHRWTARLMVFNSVIHTILEVEYFASRNSAFQVLIRDRPNQLGIWALVITLLILICALHSIQLNYYEVFLTAHILLTVIFLIFLKIHVNDHQSIAWLYLGIAIFAMDRIFRLVRILYGNLSGYAELFGNDSATHVTVKPLIPIKYKAGQFAYIYTLRYNFWQSNPFSIIQASEHKYEFIVKQYQRMTSRLHAQAVDQQNRRAYIWLEGPYGISYPLERYENVLFIAGGIGITPVMAYTMKLKNNMEIKHISIHWAIKEAGSIEWVPEQLGRLAEYDHISIHIYLTLKNDNSIPNDYNDQSFNGLKTSIERFKKYLEADLTEQWLEANLPPTVFLHTKRPVSQEIVTQTVIQTVGSQAVFSCGPGQLVDGVRKAVVSSIEKRPDRRIDYFEDSFS
ncbi:ferric reductase NAD binding domain-containing protein [Lipomyces oligophaga]|uniref:ferric reductase NAD binding domain-containing protein n=1 Tax=Lipomyces oligophaga TaxID=45792 RepID=UPI0034CEC063